MSRFRRGSRAAAAKEPVPEFEAGLVQHLGSAVPCSLAAVQEGVAERGCTCSVEVTSHTVLNWGNRHDNEDRIMTARGSHNDLSFYSIGVLDGHDTEAASDAVSKMLPMALAKHLRANEPFEQAYRETMAECEKALKKTCRSAGTCVCSCIVAGRHVWCGNLGDCRAALVMLQVPEAAAGPTKATSLCWMSRDHKASAPEEVRRIRAAGGRVVDGRVEGLEPSRTLGDFDVKMAVPEGVISIVPEVRCQGLAEEGGSPAQALLVCATDGVWDVISGQDVCDLVHARRELAAVQVAMLPEPHRPASGKVDIQPLRDLAEDLVQFAIARGSRDDCTAVIAMISVT